MQNVFQDIRAALYSIWNRKWLALAVAWGICLLGWLMLAMIPNTYESRARIFVQLDDPLEDTLQIGQGDRKRSVERVRQTLTSASNLEKVVRATRLGSEIDTPAAMEATVLSLSKTIKVVSQQDNVFEITATAGKRSLSDAENAKLAQDIVQKLINIFREENLAGSSGEMTDTIKFMDQKLGERQKQLESAEQRRLTFEAQHPELVQGGVAGLQRLEASRAELRGIDADLAAANSALAAINGQLAGTPSTIAGVGPTGGARAALTQANADLSAMRARGLTDNHPDIIAIRNQISSLKAQVQSEGSSVSGTPNPAYSSLVSIKAERQANLQALISRRASTQRELASLQSMQINNPELAAEAQRISRDYDVLKEQYDKLLKDREELLLRGQVVSERSNVKMEVTDRPTSPTKPVAPNRPILLVAVLLLGSAIGIGIAFALAQLRSSFATASQLERSTGYPVLGTISLNTTEQGRAKGRHRMKQFLAASGALVALCLVLVVFEFMRVSTVG